MCLLDNDVPGSSYCTPTCSTVADCPHGYNSCGGLVLVTTQCTSNNDCNGTRCLSGSESSIGYCECASDDECGGTNAFCNNGPFGGDDTCVFCRGNGDCFGSLFPCSEDSECGISCADLDGEGENDVRGCVPDRRVCGKEAGVLCEELKGPAICRGI